MSSQPGLEFRHLLEYTAWERQKWQAFLQKHGEQVLGIGSGPHGDGRFHSMGDLIRHIFMAEKRYVERLSGSPLTDMSSVSNTSIEALFDFGSLSRKGLEGFLETLPDAEWDVPHEMQILQHSIRATPRKIVTHILMHEIRHWGQIGCMLRLQGMTDDFHDFLFSPVMNEEKQHAAL
jgi:uncharacterized damage-inducible protein DinB